jgi:hypothetical protein
MNPRAIGPFADASRFKGGAEGSMGIVVAFPEARSVSRDGAERAAGSATVIILPVVRVERYDEDPSGDIEPSTAASGRKRRRRASRT